MKDVMALVDRASEWVHENGQYYKMPENPGEEHKWLVRSALQKCIRRGHVEQALHYGFQLLQIDPTYVWYAVATVAVEDVGFGNPDALLWSNLAMLKTFRLQVGELPLLSALIIELCAKFKTRSCCELSWVVDTDYPDVLREFSTYETSQLLEAVEERDAGMTYAALAVMTTVMPKDLKSRPKDIEGLEAAKEIIRGQLAEWDATVCNMLLKRPPDNMSIAAFPTFRISMDHAMDIELEEDLIPESKMINGYPSEAWDMHTMEGKKALKAMHSQLKRKYPVLDQVPARRIVSAMGNAVFAVEGAQVNWRIITDDLQQLKNYQDKLGLTVNGVADETVNEFLDVVRDHIPMLNELRQWSADL